jgi:ankyrin repeat protein
MGKRFSQAGPLLDELAVAIDHRRAKAVRALIDRGVDVNAPLRGIDGPEPPFRRAVQAGAQEVALMLLDAGARLGPSDLNLVWAVGTGRADVVRRFIDAGADLNIKTGLGTPIQLAARDGSAELVRLLIDAGADVNAGTTIGNALQDAVEKNHTEIARMLLDAGASLDVPCKKEFLLEMAERHNNPALGRALRAAEARAKQVAPPGAPRKRRRPPAAPGRPAAAARPPELPDWVPDFSARGRRRAYRAAVADLERLCGTPRRPMELLAGGFTFHLHSANAAGFDLDRVHADFVGRGAYVFTTDAAKRDTIAILPTTDKYEVMLAMATNGANAGLSPQDVVAWMRDLEREQPYVLTGIGWDFLDGRFTGAVREPEELAERMVAFCSDLEDPEAVAARLRESGRFGFWWD